MVNSKKSQNSGNYDVGYKKPPKNRQFGQKDGNKQGHGFWKKENTLRYKLQQVAKMSKEELELLLLKDDVGEYEKSIARILLDVAEPNTELATEERWRILSGLTNQDSGMPKQQVENAGGIQVKGFLPKPKKGKS